MKQRQIQRREAVYLRRLHLVLIFPNVPVQQICQALGHRSENVILLNLRGIKQ